MNSEALLLFPGNAKRLRCPGCVRLGEVGTFLALRHTTLKGFKGNRNVS